MKLLKSVNESYQNLLNNIDNWRERDTFEYSLRAHSQATRSYKFNCTGDVCTGDKILFVDRIWERKAINKFGKLANVIVGYELVEAEVIKDSYGAEKQQHTFTLKVGSKKRLIKGRNLYAVGVWRKAWSNEEDRTKSLDDKHSRGDSARMARQDRINERGFF